MREAPTDGPAECSKQPNASTMLNPSVNIIIPAYSSALTIEDCLKSLQTQQHSGEQFEIIVVDSGDDETQKICEYYGVRCYHSSSKLSAGAARNIGAETTEGKIVAFIDADCIAPDLWLYHLQKDLDEFPEAFGILGTYEGGRSGLDKVRGGELMSSEKRIGFHRGFIEGNAAFRRQVFERDCRFGDMTYGECVELSIELAQRGMQTVWDPSLKVYHKGHLTYRRMFAMDRAYARNSLRGGARVSGISKLLFLTAMFVSLPFWPLATAVLALFVLAVPLAYSLTDDMVAWNHRLRFLPILISMRLSRLLASVIETTLYLLRGASTR